MLAVPRVDGESSRMLRREFGQPPDQLLEQLHGVAEAIVGECG
jgi:hypothetical protein